MVAIFVHFQHTFNRLFNNYIDIRLVLLEVWRGGGVQPDPLLPPPTSPQKKLLSKSSALLGLMKRFLKDENCDVDAIEMRCLKPRVGLTTVMENHLPDIGIFKTHDVIDGPLEVLLLRG